MDQQTFDQYQVQQALQRQGIEGNQQAYAPQLQEQIQQTQAVLVEQTNPKKVINDIMLRLRGLEEKPGGELIQVATPKMNKDGIDAVWYILESHINQNVILSHLNETEIANIMDSLQDSIVDKLSLKWKEYEIDKTDLDTINDSILVNIFLCLKRAEGQNEKNWLGKISVENISSQSRLPTVKKDGFLSKFRL